MIEKLIERFARSNPLPVSQAPWWSARGLPNERDYNRQVGDGSGSSLVGPGIDFITDSFVEAPLRIRPKVNGKLGDPIVDHPALELAENPNPYYSSPLLWMPTISNWVSDGNAYWMPQHWSAAGEPLDLYFTPSICLEPKPSQDGMTFLHHYTYKPGGNNTQVDIGPDEVIHFRWGLDPMNPLKGFSRLKRVIREIYSDEEAARFTAALLHNMGAPGLLIFPKGEVISVEEAKTAKQEIMQKTTGDRRGEPVVMTSESGMERLGFSPEELDLSNLRAIPESRVAAALQIPAAVLGFLAGMTQTKVGATMLEMREMGFESGVAPKMRLMAEELRMQLLRHFTDDPKKYHIDFDLSEVRVLQEDQSKLVRRVDMMVRGGWMKVKRAKEVVGEIPEDGDDVYLRTSGMKEVGPDAPELPEMPEVPQNPPTPLIPKVAASR